MNSGRPANPSDHLARPCPSPRQDASGGSAGGAAAGARTGSAGRLRRAALLLAGGLLLPHTAPNAADAVLHLHYNDRPPFNVPGSDGRVTGLTAVPAELVLRQAGIPFVWEMTPLNRQFKIIEEARGYDCAVGLYRSPAREAIGQFSEPLYRDRGLVGLARASLKLRSGGKAADLIANPNLTLMVKSGLSYGRSFSGLVAQLRPQVEMVSVETVQMLRMIMVDRADWMIASEEEAGFLMQRADLKPGDITVLHFSDITEGEPRHLYCSRAVPRAWIARINAAIRSLPAALTGRQEAPKARFQDGALPR